MSVWKYVKVNGAWRYKAAIEDKGKIIPNMVRVNGHVEFHEEGTYYFRSGRQWIRLDAMPTSTQAARERLQAHDLAVRHGLVSAPSNTLPNSLRDAIEPYLTSYAPGHEIKTVNGIRRRLNAFLALIGNKRLSAVTKEDVKKFWQQVVDESPTNSWRTASNECNKVRMFLVEHGVDVICEGKNSKGEKRLRQQVGRLDVSPDELDGRNQRSALFKTVFLVFRGAGAKDWRSQVAIALNHSGSQHKLQFHHIFPKAVLKSNYTSREADDIANLCFIAGKTNQQISDKPPEKYFPEMIAKSGLAAFEAQCIPTESHLIGTDRLGAALSPSGGNTKFWQ